MIMVMMMMMMMMIIHDMMNLSTAIGLPSGGSSTVDIYTQTVHRTTKITTEKHK